MFSLFPHSIIRFLDIIFIAYTIFVSLYCTKYTFPYDPSPNKLNISNCITVFVFLLYVDITLFFFFGGVFFVTKQVVLPLYFGEKYRLFDDIPFDKQTNGEFLLSLKMSVWFLKCPGSLKLFSDVSKFWPFYSWLEINFSF